MTVEIRNSGDTPVDLYLRGRTIAVDITVERGSDTVWRRLENEIVPAVIQVRTLAPGEVMRLDAEWDQRTRNGAPAGAGRFSVRATVLTDGAPLATPPVTLEIRER